MLVTSQLRFIALSLVLASGTVRAAEEYGNSLDWVPADATAYSASLRLKEQFDIVAESNAWQRFTEIPAVAAGWAMAEEQLYDEDGPAAMFWQLMELPENEQLAQLLGEMFSEEIVFYAGADFAKTIELFQYIQGSRIAPLIEAAQDGDDVLGDAAEIRANGGDARLRFVIDAIVEDPALLNVPQLVLAFRIQDADAADTQLARLKVLANMVLQQTELDAKFEEEELAGGKFIVLTLDGEMIAWDEIDSDGMPFDEETFEALRDAISDQQLSIALGGWNGYLIVAIGKSTEQLEALGEGETIGEREEFEPLKKYLDERVVSVSYVSEEIVKQGHMTPEDLDGIAEEIDGAVQDADELPEEVKERASEDLTELADDMKRYLSKPGPMASVTFLTDTGFEGVSYNWSEMPGLVASEPLPLLEHLGGSPLAAMVARGKHDPELYDLLAKWTGKAVGYFEEFALDQMDESESEEIDAALEIIKPLAARLDKTTRELLIPSLADGQSGLIFDAKIESTQWHQDMPESFRPLPMAELAIVVGVSDAAGFKKAVREYKAIAADAIEAIREQAPDEIPEDFEIPEPDKRSTDDGTLYVWTPPSEAGLDERIGLCFAVGEEVAALASSTELAERVLAAKPLPAAEVLGESDAPRAIVAGIDFAGLVAAAAPWVEYGIRMNFAEESVADDPEDDPSEVQDLCSQVATGLEIAQCFRGSWMDLRQQDEAWVTRTVTTFQDLEDE